jgi:hypothetical protein
MEASISAARKRVLDSLRAQLSWDGWQRDCAEHADEALAMTRKVLGDAALLAMSREALANDGHCRADAEPHVIAGLVYEQVYLSRMTRAVQERGNFWGGKTAVPPSECRWSRARAVMGAAEVATLEHEGLVVIDGALTADEAAAARAEVAALDRRGDLAEVSCQSKARIRNDRIGWVDERSGHGAIGVAVRLLRALAHEVEAHTDRRLRVPANVMAAIYDGSKARPTYANPGP